MNILNLTSGFEPLGKGMAFENKTFPCGSEQYFRLSADTYHSHCCIVMRMKNSEDLMRLLLATDALRRAGVIQIELFLAYLPYARQDRISREGESLSIKIIADLINLQNFFRVWLFDPHSDVASALINQSKVISNFDWVQSVVRSKSNFRFVAPDAGSYKKLQALSKEMSVMEPLVVALKSRDPITGKSESSLFGSEDLQGKDLYIVDDICDTGGTVVHVAEKLRALNCGKIYMIVTHGIFSSGTKRLQDCLDGIITTNSWSDESTDFVTRVAISAEILGDLEYQINGVVV
jgi:ribose-phosphate pyrophosphokinase